MGLFFYSMPVRALLRYAPYQIRAFSCRVGFSLVFHLTDRRAPMFGRSEYMIDLCFSFTLTTLQVARNISSLKEHL